MERKWLALTPGDSLPLRLGAVVRPKPVVRKVVDSRAGPVKWVDDPQCNGFSDVAVQLSDLAHEAAPRPIGTKQAKATTAAQVNAAAESAWDVFRVELRPRNTTVLYNDLGSGGEKTASGLSMLIKASERLLAVHSGRSTHCPDCGASEGSKHFLHCHRITDFA